MGNRRCCCPLLNYLHSITKSFECKLMYKISACHSLMCDITGFQMNQMSRCKNAASCVYCRNYINFLIKFRSFLTNFQVHCRSLSVINVSCQWKYCKNAGKMSVDKDPAPQYNTISKAAMATFNNVILPLFITILHFIVLSRHLADELLCECNKAFCRG